MRRKSSWVSLLLVASAIPLSAIAQNAFTLRDTDVYAGPSSEYPPVTTLPANAGVSIAGCLNDWSWCDVYFSDSRGWVYAADLGYPYQNDRVVIIEYGPRLGIPVVAFSLPVYWNAHYRARPWYREREQWVTRVHVEANRGGKPPEGRAAARTARPAEGAQLPQPGQPPRAPQPPQTAQPQVTQPPQAGQTSQRERSREENTRASQAQQPPPTTQRQQQGAPPSDAANRSQQDRQRPQAVQPAESPQAGHPSEGRPPEGRPSERRPPEGRPPETARPQESASQHEGGRAAESGRQQQEKQQETKRPAEGRKPANEQNNDRDKQ